jgi:hypothetical protein
MTHKLADDLRLVAKGDNDEESRAAYGRLFLLTSAVDGAIRNAEEDEEEER